MMLASTYIYIYICQCGQARLFIATWAPIQPHDGTGLEDTDVEWRWSRIPQKIDKNIGLAGAIESAYTFRKHFSIEEPEEPDDDEIFAGPEPFVPDEKGVMHQLPDKVLVAVRMRLEHERYQPEWMLPNRRTSPISRMCIDIHAYAIFHEPWRRRCHPSSTTATTASVCCICGPCTHSCMNRSSDGHLS